MVNNSQFCGIWLRYTKDVTVVIKLSGDGLKLYCNDLNGKSTTNITVVDDKMYFSWGDIGLPWGDAYFQLASEDQLLERGKIAFNRNRSAENKINSDFNDLNARYTKLMNKESENVYLRNDLDRKLAEINEYSHTNIEQSQIELDNTIYFGVMCSILATSLAYFVFIKL